jgi:shikimate kinase
MTDLALRTPSEPSALALAVARMLDGRSLVLVGMMGAGKSSIGRRLAARMGLPFVDADTEIEAAAGMSIPDIFEAHGELYFRAGEARVITRLLSDGPRVVATGGGAFMNPGTRAQIASRGLSVWLNAELDVLLRRIRRRSDRPLLQTEDPEATLSKLIAERYPVYAEADLTVQSREVPHDVIVEEIVAALAGRFGIATPAPPAAVPDAEPPAGPSPPQAEEGSPT